VRKLVVNEFLTADGVMEAPNEWHGPCFDDDLLIDPVLAGRGKRLFQDGPAPTPLTVVSSQMFGSGVRHIVCAPQKP
jgi:hypothetical protein